MNIGFNCDVSFPASFTAVLSSLRFVNIDVVPSIGLSCVELSFDYIDTLYIVTLGPIMVAAGLLIVLVTIEYKLFNYLFRWDDQQLKDLISSIPRELRDKIPPEVIGALHAAFRHFDIDASGKIDQAEIALVIREFDIGASDKEVEQQAINIFETESVVMSPRHKKGGIDFASFLSSINSEKTARAPRTCGPLLPFKATDTATLCSLVDRVNVKIGSRHKTTISYLFLVRLLFEENMFY